MSKQMSSNSFKNQITNKLSTYESYIHFHLDVLRQKTGVKLLLLHSITWNNLTWREQIINSN